MTTKQNPEQSSSDPLDDLIREHVSDGHAGCDDSCSKKADYTDLIEAILDWHLQKSRSYLPDEMKHRPGLTGVDNGWNSCLKAITKRIEEDVWMQTTPTNSPIAGELKQQIEDELKKAYYKGKDGDSFPDSQLQLATQAIRTIMEEVLERVVGEMENSEGNKPHGDVRNQLRATQREIAKSELSRLFGDL